MPTPLYEALQRELKALQFDPGPIDGVWGPKTRKAMQAYERAHMLPLTDMPNDAFLTALLGPKAAPAPIGWLDEATRLLGLKEGPGAQDNPIILDWADDLDIHYPHDDIAWCGLFDAHCIRTALPNEALPTNPLGAREWEKLGGPCVPQLGAVAVFWRKSIKSGLGHTGFMIGERKDAYLIRGGNQSDSVKDVWVGKNRFIAARWPVTGPKPYSRPLTAGGLGALSLNEA